MPGAEEALVAKRLEPLEGQLPELHERQVVIGLVESGVLSVGED